MNTSNRVAFVLASVGGASMLVNRMDFSAAGLDDIGNGLSPSTILLAAGHADTDHYKLLEITEACHAARTGGMVVIDGGANIGSYSIPWARQLKPWHGSVLAFEPQEYVYYALAGNIALNNMFNVRAFNAGLAREACEFTVPVLDYQKHGNFSGLSLNPACADPRFGQPVDYSTGTKVRGIAIDDLRLPRLDIFKLDIEGMELEAICGARKTIAQYRPLMFVETLLAHSERILDLLGTDWQEVHISRINSVFFHEDAPERELLRSMHDDKCREPI